MTSVSLNAAINHACQQAPPGRVVTVANPTPRGLSVFAKNGHRVPFAAGRSRESTWAKSSWSLLAHQAKKVRYVFCAPHRTDKLLHRGAPLVGASLLQ